MNPTRPSIAGLTVLCLLRAAPLHPYGMQRLIKSWGKDAVVNIGQRANLYKTIKRLHEAGLIAVHQTERSQLYPERTVYELTDEGRDIGPHWLVSMLAQHRNEYPEFPAALSFAMALEPEKVLGALSERLTTLNKERSELNNQISDSLADLPRIVLLETEYQLAILDAEIHWLQAVVEDLKSGELNWSEDELAIHAAETVVKAAAS